MPPTTSYIARGNATATTHYFLTSGSVTGSISAFAQYDIAGNLVKAIDRRGYASTFGYSDNFGSPDTEAETNSAPTELSTPGQASYAFATSVTNALNQTAHMQFDYHLGRPVNAKDANGVVTAIYSDANEPLDRPTKVIRAINNDAASESIFSYDDTNHLITVASNQTSLNDGHPLKSQTVYDGLGRATEKRQYENATDYITVRQTYDSLGRLSQTSNPFRAGETILWTTTAYDALSRLISLTTPDSAVAAAAYSGNTVTVTDQTGKTRKSLSDALGQLKEVYEDPSGVNYLTSYSYDALGDLVTVNQGSQTRTFVYDSLKRLTSAANPESGTVSYQYDSAGNLLVNTDARSVSSHYDYDAISRVTRRWYNGSSSTFATTNNSPTLPSGVGASDEVSYFYDSQPLPSGAPTFDRGYSTDRLIDFGLLRPKIRFFLLFTNSNSSAARSMMSCSRARSLSFSIPSRCLDFNQCSDSAKTTPLRTGSPT